MLAHKKRKLPLMIPDSLEEAQYNTRDLLALERGTITSESLKMATLMVVTLPVLFVYPFFQRYYIRGLLIGSPIG